MQPLEEKPVESVLMTLNYLSYLFVLTALAAGIAWIYYVAKAVDAGEIGGEEGGDDGAATTAEIMFQGTVASLLLYFVFRHHFSMSHQ